MVGVYIGYYSHNRNRLIFILCVLIHGTVARLGLPFYITFFWWYVFGTAFFDATFEKSGKSGSRVLGKFASITTYIIARNKSSNGS